jgi:hypothetical protein
MKKNNDLEFKLLFIIYSIFEYLFTASNGQC